MTFPTHIIKRIKKDERYDVAFIGWKFFGAESKTESLWSFKLSIHLGILLLQFIVQKPHLGFFLQEWRLGIVWFPFLIK